MERNNNDYTFFWLDDQENGYLSNWYDSPFIIGEFRYRWVEQYLMSRKAVLFKDIITNTRILRAHSPSECKKLGKQVDSFDLKIWNDNKERIIYEGCKAKFDQNLKLQQRLLATGNSIIAEASPYDKVWGIGLDADDAVKVPEDDWPGDNLLGKTLMKIKEEFRKTALGSPIKIGRKFSSKNEKTGKTEHYYVLHNDPTRNKLEMRLVGSNKTIECPVNDIGKIFKAQYDSKGDDGIVKMYHFKDGVYYLNDIDHLAVVTIYKETVDFVNKLTNVNAAMLSMKQQGYIYLELQKNVETNEFYIEIKKWQKYQKEYGGLICDLVFLDQDKGVRTRNFTDHLNAYSMLRLYGYYVGGTLKDEERQRILMNCVYFNLVSLKDVLSHIDYLRKNSGNKARARALWTKDYEFIKDYERHIKTAAYSKLRKRKQKWRNDPKGLIQEFKNEYKL